MSNRQALLVGAVAGLAVRAVAARRRLARRDLGLALVEMLAVVGDLLSAHQDAVATEAQLGPGWRRRRCRCARAVYSGRVAGAEIRQ